MPGFRKNDGMFINNPTKSGLSCYRVKETEMLAPGLEAGCGLKTFISIHSDIPKSCRECQEIQWIWLNFCYNQRNSRPKSKTARGDRVTALGLAPLF